MKYLFGLRIRLIALVLLAIIPALGLTLYTGMEQRESAAAAAKADAWRLARLSAASLEEIKEGARQLLIALAQLPAVRGRDAAGCNALFANLEGKYPRYLNFGVAAPDGQVFCSAIPLAGPVNYSDYGWFQTALQTPNIVIGEYQLSRITQQPVLYFAQSVTDQAAGVQAVVFVALDVGWLNQQVAGAQLPEGAAITVFDRNGTILARYPNPQQWVGQSLPDEPLTRIVLKYQSGATEVVDLDGVQRLHGFASLGGTPAVPLFVSVGIPSQVAFAEANGFRNRNLAALGGVAILAILAAAWGSNAFILRQVGALVKATKRLATGDLSVRTGLPPGPGEINQLAQAFDSMAEALEQRDTALRESELRYTNILTIAADAIIAVDEAQRIQLFNQGAERFFGYSSDEALGQPLDLLLPPRFVEAHRQHVRDFALEPVQARRMAERREVMGRRKDGTEFPAEASISKMSLKGPITFTVILRDISDRKQAEQEIRRLNAQLEQKVIERTAQLGVATAELESFAAATSQDLPGPLRRIRSFGQALLEDYGDRLDARGRDYLERMLAASQHMSDLTGALVNLSRLARTEIYREAVDLSALADSLAGELQQAQPERAVEFSIAPGLVADADVRLMRTLLEHLLGNAWKFTSQHARARIEFDAFRQSDGETVYFVRDDGAGFDPTSSSRLFLAFQRLHPADEFPGVGMGLAIAQRIVRLHGGQIWGEGQVEKGATFYFTLPAAGE
jgi:PAS domain S-box-containing protein